MITLIFTGLGCCAVCSGHQGQGRICVWVSARVNKDTCGRKKSKETWSESSSDALKTRRVSLFAPSVPAEGILQCHSRSQMLSRLRRSDLKLRIWLHSHMASVRTSSEQHAGIRIRRERTKMTARDGEWMKNEKKDEWKKNRGWWTIISDACGRW